MKIKFVKVKLVFPAFLHGKPPKAVAIAEARETETQYVVLRENVDIVKNPGNVRFGRAEARYRKKDGRLVGGHSSVPTWYCAGPV